MENRKFKLPEGKIIQLNYLPIKKFIANIPPFFGNIKIDKLFYGFDRKEKTSIIYHELWHRENNTKWHDVIT